MKLLIITLFIFAQAISQEPINQLNDKGKMTGFWTQYLDSRLNPCDSIDAAYYGYNNFDNGNPLFKFYKSAWGERGELKIGISMEDPIKPVMLSGTFTWLDNQGDTLAYEKYKNGIPIYKMSVQNDRESGTIFYEIYDFTKLYKGQIGSYYCEEIFVNNNLNTTKVKRYWFCKPEGKNKWKSIKIEK